MRTTQRIAPRWFGWGAALALTAMLLAPPAQAEHERRGNSRAQVRVQVSKSRGHHCHSQCPTHHPRVSRGHRCHAGCQTHHPRARRGYNIGINVGGPGYGLSYYESRGYGGRYYAPGGYCY